MQHGAGSNEYLLGFNRTALVKDVLRRALKLFPIKDRFSAALFVPASQMWMPLAASLDELRLEENVRPLPLPPTPYACSAILTVCRRRRCRRRRRVADGEG